MWATRSDDGGILAAAAATAVAFGAFGFTHGPPSIALSCNVSRATATVRA